MNKLLSSVLMTCTLMICGTTLIVSAAPAAEPNENQSDHPQMIVEPFAEFVTPSDSLPHLRFFADGKVTLNDRCPVRRVRLNPKMGASYVNNQPVGFC